jgi:hypothetical protein
MKKALFGLLMIAVITPTIWSQQKIQKDERLGVLLSLSAPGVGQIYAGNTWRGIGIMAAEAVCMGVVVGVTERPKKIKVEDINGNTHEIWTKRNPKLKGGEIAAVATAGVAGLGIYIWQLFDARNCVKKHNKEQGFDVGLGVLPNGGTGFSLNMTF